jgi:hypothetical protein
MNNKNINNSKLLNLDNKKVKISDLTNEQKTLSIVIIQWLVNKLESDEELGKEIRTIFKELG